MRHRVRFELLQEHAVPDPVSREPVVVQLQARLDEIRKTGHRLSEARVFDVPFLSALQISCLLARVVLFGHERAVRFFGLLFLFPFGLFLFSLVLEDLVHLLSARALCALKTHDICRRLETVGYEKLVDDRYARRFPKLRVAVLSARLVGELYVHKLLGNEKLLNS